MQAAAIAVGGASCALAWACLAPTSIKISITTNLDCAAVSRNGVSIYGSAGSSDPITTSKSCEGEASPRMLGSFVFTPSGDRDDAVTIAVVAGVTRRSDECAANGYAGCIVSRRRLRFVPHEPLDLPIDLSLACLDRAAAPGKCVSTVNRFVARRPSAPPATRASPAAAHLS